MMDAEYPEFDCVDCDINTLRTQQYYMVHDHLWKQAGMSLQSNTGMLCFDCLEVRIGRPLRKSDLTIAPVNWWHRDENPRFQ